MDKNYFEEITYQWHLARWAKFTSSKISCILVDGGKNIFGSGALTYIEQLACDAVSEYEDQSFEGSWAMREGKKKEPDAHKAYVEVITPLLKNDMSVVYYGGGNPIFIPHPKYPDEAGASPDGCIEKSGKSYILLEYKCPTRIIQFRRLKQLKNYATDDRHCWLREYEKDLYAQTQFGMVCMGVDICHWISYNELMKDPADRMIIIEVPRDNKFCNNLNMRLSMAINKKKQFINS